MIRDAGKAFPPLWEELGYEQIAPHIFTPQGGKARLLSAERLWGHLRENLTRLRQRKAPAAAVEAQR